MPGPSWARHGVLRLGIQALDLILTAVANPDPVLNTLVRINRRLSGFKIRHQNIGGTVWPYLEGGTLAHGEHVVLLHGFGADKDRFGVLGPSLKRYYHVVIPDLPGFGDHLPDWSSIYGVEDQVRRFHRFVKATGLETFHLFGISLGGYIAAYYAAQHPHRIRSLCLMDSAGFSTPYISDAMSLYRSGNRNIFLPNSGMEMQEMVDFIMHRPVQLPARIRAYWMQLIRDQLAWRKKMLDDLMDNGLELLDGLARSIKMPTLVVWGAEDRICHVSTVSRILEMIDNCRAYIIRGCGHVPILEFPWLSKKIYMDFLQLVGQWPIS